MPFRYNAPARALHWITVLAMVAQIVLGIWITTFEPKDESFKFLLYNIHENIGFTLLTLTLYRLWYRRTHPPAPLPADLPAMMRFIAHANHAALYLALIGMPILGVLATSAWGFPFKWLGILPIPSPFGKNEALAPIFSQFHFIGAWLFVIAILGHVGGALFHGFIRRDGVLQRMI